MKPMLSLSIKLNLNWQNGYYVMQAVESAYVMKQTEAILTVFTNLKTTIEWLYHGYNV